MRNAVFYINGGQCGAVLNFAGLVPGKCRLPYNKGATR